MHVVTAEWIHACATVNGGWTAAQLKILGVEWPPQHGWIARCVGMQITTEQRDLFFAMREQYSA